MADRLKETIIAELDKLTEDQQAQLLDYARRIQHTSRPAVTSGNRLVALAGQFQFASEDLQEIIDAIEEGCEQVDLNGWQ